MATAKEYLESILISVADLQRAAPEHLAIVVNELKEIDDELGSIRDFVIEHKG